MKKNISLFVVFSVLLILAIGCSTGGMEEDVNSNGASSESDEVTTVVYWTLFGGPAGEFMEEMVDEFNELHPNIHVDHQVQDWDEYYTRLVTAVLGDSAPDLAVSHQDRLKAMIYEGVLEPMDEEAEAYGVNWSDFIDLDAVNIDGNYYGVPIDYHSLLLFYNKNILEELNLLNGENEPEFDNYDEFVEVLTTVKNSDYIGLTFPQNGEDVIRLWHSFYTQMGGGNLLNEEATEAIFNTEIGRDSLQKVYDLYHTHEVIPPQIDEFEELFRSERAAFAISGTWALNNLYQSLGDDMGVMAFPTLFDEPGVWSNSHSFVLPVNQERDEQKTEAVMTFVTWAIEHGYKWTEGGFLPTTNTVLESEEFNEQPMRDDYAHQTEYLKFINPAHRNWFPSGIDVTDGIMLGNMSVEDGLERLEEVVNQELER